MKTEEMIRELARNARPVERPSHPLARFSMWMAVGVLYLAVCVSLIGTRGDLAHVWYRAEFLIHTLLVLCLVAVTALSAFVLSVPGREHRWAVWISAIALVAWLAWVVGALAGAADPRAGSGQKCLENIAVLSMPLGMLLYYMLSKAAPLNTAATGMLAALSASAAGDLATRFICRYDGPFHALVWHYVPVLAIGCAGLFLGRILLQMGNAED